MLLFVGSAGALEVELRLLHLDLGILAVLQADREEDQVCPLRPLHEWGDNARPESQNRETLRLRVLLHCAQLNAFALELWISLGFIHCDDDGAHGPLLAVLFALFLHRVRAKWRLSERVKLARNEEIIDDPIACDVKTTNRFSSQSRG